MERVTHEEREGAAEGPGSGAHRHRGRRYECACRRQQKTDQQGHFQLRDRLLQGTTDTYLIGDSLPAQTRLPVCERSGLHLRQGHPDHIPIRLQDKTEESGRQK